MAVFVVNKRLGSICRSSKDTVEKLTSLGVLSANHPGPRFFMSAILLPTPEECKLGDHHQRPHTQDSMGEGKVA